MGNSEPHLIVERLVVAEFAMVVVASRHSELPLPPLDDNLKTIGHSTVALGRNRIRHGGQVRSVSKPRRFYFYSTVCFTLDTEGEFMLNPRR